MVNVGPCFLHIPHKDWAQDLPGGEKEYQNYVAIEDWSRRFLDCFPHNIL